MGQEHWRQSRRTYESQEEIVPERSSALGSFQYGVTERDFEGRFGGRNVTRGRKMGKQMRRERAVSDVCPRYDLSQPRSLSSCLYPRRPSLGYASAVACVLFSTALRRGLGSTEPTSGNSMFCIAVKDTELLVRVSGDTNARPKPTWTSVWPLCLYTFYLCQ